MDKSLKIALVSLAVSTAVLSIKYVAYVLTGSVALFSDALESIVNVVSAGSVIVAIRIAARPPDAEHPYGHHKAEYLTAVVVGVMIVFAAFAIMWEALQAFQAPEPIEDPWVGLVVSMAATLLNVVWSIVLVRQGKENRSASLIADGKHLLADVITSVAVLVGVVAVVVTGMMRLDSIIAGLVALHVLWSGWGVIRDNASGLLDEAAPAEELAIIRQIISESAAGGIEVHDLRTRHAGKATFIDFHLVVPGTMSVGDSHRICDCIEAAMQARIGGAITTIHVEPEEKAKRRGIILA